PGPLGDPAGVSGAGAGHYGRLSRVTRTSLLPLLPLLPLAPPPGGRAQPPPQTTLTPPAAQAIPAAGIRGHRAGRSADLLQGRAPGTQRGRLAARYIASQLTLIGLQPPPDGFRQRVRIDAWRPDSARSHIVFALGADSIAAAWNG